MSDASKLINETIDRNKEDRTEVQSLIAQGEAIAFVGAGLSIPLGYPSWHELLVKLSSEAEACGNFSPQSNPSVAALQHAQELREHFEKTQPQGTSRYFNILAREFEPKKDRKPFERTHSLIVELPFRAFVTTNYDECLNCALQDYSRRAEVEQWNADPSVVIKLRSNDRHLVSIFLRSIATQNPRQRRYVAHLHGKWNDTENIILTSRDYEEAYEQNHDTLSNHKTSQLPIHFLLMWSILATRRLVFFGTSMRDPYIKRLLETVSRDLWEYKLPVHYVILPLESTNIASMESEKDEFAKYGIRTVFFDNTSGDFKELERFLEESRLVVPDGPLEPNSIRDSPADSSDDHQALIGLQSSPFPEGLKAVDWLKQVNRATLAFIRNQNEN
jgi:hypothetical protein